MSLTKVTYSMIEGSMVNVKDYGAIGDGIADDTAALNLAFATNNAVYLPPGNYKITTNLTPPICSAIIGAGMWITTITAATGVTKALSINASPEKLNLISDLSISGNATASATGLLLGDTNLIDYLDIRNVRVVSFSGTGSIGIYVKNVLLSNFYNCYADSNETGIFIGSTLVSSLPTTINVNGGQYNNNTKYGLRCQQGRSIIFRGTTFENNTLEGILVDPPVTGKVDQLTFYDVWLESNNDSSSSNYQVTIDGTANPTVCAVRFRGGYVGGGSAKTFNFDGDQTFDVQGIYIPNVNQPQIIVQNGAVGQVVLDERIAGGLYSYLSDANNGTISIYEYSGTFVVNDNTTLTVTGTPTYTGRYRKINGRVFVEINLKSTGNISATGGSSFLTGFSGASAGTVPANTSYSCASVCNGIPATLGIGLLQPNGRVYLPAFSLQDDVYISFSYDAAN